LVAALENPTEDHEVRRRSALALGTLGNVHTFSVLSNAFQHPDAEAYDATLRAYLAEALGILRDPRAIGPLVEALGSEHADVRKAAWPALVEIGGQAVVPLTEALLTLPERPFAARALGELGDPRTIEPLILVLRNRNRSVYTRLWAADALGKLRATAAFDILLFTLLNERESVLVRRQAAIALCYLDDPRAVEPVVSIVDQPGTQWTAELVNALGHLGHERAVSTLVAVLLGGSIPLRERAAKALGQIGSPRARLALESVREAHQGEGFWDRRVRDATALAIDRICQRPAR
jgi:HEAT repeat protein